MAAAFAAMESEEAAQVETLTHRVEEDTAKGRDASNQLAMWDRLMDTRIRLNRSLLLSNRLPQRAAGLLRDPAAAQRAAEAKELLRTLLELQEALIDQNPSTAAVSKARPRKRAREADTDELWSTVDAYFQSLVPFVVFSSLEGDISINQSNLITFVCTFAPGWSRLSRTALPSGAPRPRWRAHA